MPGCGLRPVYAVRSTDCRLTPNQGSTPTPGRYVPARAGSIEATADRGPPRRRTFLVGVERAQERAEATPRRVHPEFHAGRPPRNKGMRYPADPPTIEEIVTVMRRTSSATRTPSRWPARACR